MSPTALVPENSVVPPWPYEPSAPKWAPPFDTDKLRFVLERLVGYTPLSVEAIFDDLDTAVGNQTPPPAAATALVERLHGHLRRLSDIAVAHSTHTSPAEIARLIERGRLLRDEPLPSGRQETVGLARRLAFVVADLVEVLIESRSIKDCE
ncbi:hypothetical protein GCM10010277_68670 [Streptomyces longisporoflavus]|uniref:DUF6415 family natural product biosynthesis protein n=1 Tax=Streptomyces longisporoflavus TaxID=28044 RepID=UPI00167DAEFF|nr:DUF6415 family natural product biosynthesis protein [Streptomyces longisporoflavus]GGV62942.1 hypothetical protein GCM10010277_68670 [Streptomyces longisporoflavus]